MKVLLVGVVTREMAESAVAAGYDVVSLDYFGDSDQPSNAEVHSLVRDFHLEPTVQNLARAAKSLVAGVDRVVLGAGLENSDSFLEICDPKSLRSNSIAAVHRVRDLRNLPALVEGTGVLVPQTIFPGKPLPSKGKWLVKDTTKSGGMGVMEWDGRSMLHKHHVLQKQIEGELMSACFIADGENAQMIGISRQYAGVKELNAPVFAWCGNVAPILHPALQLKIASVVEQLTRLVDLRGVNGIDFILQQGVPYLLEVNPRWPGSLELFEQLWGINLFQAHVDGCEGKLLEGLPPDRIDQVVGKGILYAREEILLADTSHWEQRDLADIPHSGERIPAGAPICSVYDRSADPKECWDRILVKAHQLYQELISRDTTEKQ